ncbi:MAG: hypothetical protein GY929_13000 [Actinomycetia bacterium]|nr:hypothetical protein [Actinomycetes bacterium]
MTLVQGEGVVDVPIGPARLLWGPENMLPLQLNDSGAAIWDQFAAPTPAAEATQQIATLYRQPESVVGPAVAGTCQALVDTGLLLTPTASPPRRCPPVEAEPVALVDPRTAEWLNQISPMVASLTVAGRPVPVTATNETLLELLGATFGAGPDKPPSTPALYRLVDTEGHHGYRFWLLSQSGLPLDHAHRADTIVDHLGYHLGELGLLRHQRDTVELRLAVLDHADHCLAVQWDLLASRPMLEPHLEALGYSIRSGQWARIDADDHWVQPAVALHRADADRGPPLPLRAVLAWFGAGSLEPAQSEADWVWTLAVMGAIPWVDQADRAPFLERLIGLVRGTEMIGLTDPGPTALLSALEALAAVP